MNAGHGGGWGLCRMLAVWDPGPSQPVASTEIPRQTLGYLLILFGLEGHITDPGGKDELHGQGIKFDAIWLPRLAL